MHPTSLIAVGSREDGGGPGDAARRAGYLILAAALPYLGGPVP